MEDAEDLVGTVWEAKDGSRVYRVLSVSQGLAWVFVENMTTGRKTWIALDGLKKRYVKETK